MAARKRYTRAKILEAMAGSGGIISTVAKRLDCDWCTAKKFIHRWETTKNALEDEQEKVLDLCESTLVRSISQGDTHSAKWLLSKKGKQRGYGDEYNVTGGIKVIIEAQKELDDFVAHRMQAEMDAETDGSIPDTK